MNKKEELEFLEKRYMFRMTLFREYFFEDKTLITDLAKFGKDTNEIMERIAKLKK